MAGGDAADPWSAPEGDPCRGDEGWAAGAQASGEAVDNEPNAEIARIGAHRIGISREMEAATEAGLETRLPPQDAVFQMGPDKHRTIGIPGGSRAIGNSGKTPSKKLLIPTFSGDIEGTGDLGTSARSYLRQIAAREKMTKLSLDQRALVLYQTQHG